jgi:hypothetical protein
MLDAAARPGKRGVVRRRSSAPTAPPPLREAGHAPVGTSARPSGVVARSAERAASQPAPQARRAPTRVADEQPTTRDGVDTELGGLFFLLNIGLFLGLYGDFTTPDEPGIALDPWDFVALVGATLLGRDTRFDDAVWPLLGELAGRRPDERPGRQFEPPTDWRIPAAWLDPFDVEGDWLWSTARGTLRIVHPAGFAVVAVALRGRDPQKALRRELRRHSARPSLRRAALPAESRVPLRRWTRRLSAYAAARIQVAMGDPDRDHAVNSLLRRHAKVFQTEAHVDVSMPLFSLPIEIRLAGLDRDPGWIPPAGRFVSFHFE